MKNIIILLSLSILMVTPIAVSADALGAGLLNESVGKTGLSNDLPTTAANVVSAVLAVVGTIFLVLTVAAGIMWMTAAGNEEKITKAKNIIVAAVIGLVITLSAYTITYFIGTRVSGEVGGGDKTTYQCQGGCTTSCPSPKVWVTGKNDCPSETPICCEGQ